jgi:hypothetical protein
MESYGGSASLLSTTETPTRKTRNRATRAAHLEL